MKIKIIRYVSLTLLILWMGVIFAFSAQKANESTKVSDGILTTVAKLVFPDYENLDKAGQRDVIDKFSMPIRKTAHFAEYLVLGALAFVFFSTFYNLKPVIRLLSPLILGSIYAVSDEIHQSFVAGRACKRLDILIDFTGVLFAIFIGYIITRKTAGEGNE